MKALTSLLRAGIAASALLAVLAVGLWLSGSGFSGFGDLIGHARWDGEHYVSIAERGYYLRPCTQEVLSRGFTICGNPWYPGWPLWNRAVAEVTGASVPAVFFWTTLLFGWLALFLAAFWGRLLLKDPGKDELPWLLAALTFFQPGGFYLFTVFPYAFLIVLSWLYLRLYYEGPFRGRLLTLFLLGVCISSAYPTAALVALFPLAAELPRWWREREGVTWIPGLVRIALLCGAFTLGTVGLGLWFRAQFGDFLLYFHQQAQFGHAVDYPWMALWRSFSSIHWEEGRLRGEVAESLTFLWYGAGLILFASGWRKFRVEAVIYLAAVFFFSPLTGTSMSVYRQYLLLFPLAPWIAYSSRPAWMKWGWVAFGAVQFVAYLPRYLAGWMM